MSQLKEFYTQSVVPEMQSLFGYSNVMQIPKITKVTLNMGIGEAANDKKMIESAVKDMTAISGQKPIITKTRKAVASFKIRDGWPIGCKVTLRGHSMYEFLQRLITISLPRMRDFRGLNPKSFDGRGNYNFGIKELIVFPEIDFDTDPVWGVDICITTSAKNDDQARALLKLFSLPIK
jgi:large subunit ribosomal protein L5